MGILIEGTKVFEDDRTVTYSFRWPGVERSGEVSVAKADVRALLPAPDSPLDPAAAKIVMKAYKEAAAAGTWPDKVLYAA